MSIEVKTLTETLAVLSSVVSAGVAGADTITDAGTRTILSVGKKKSQFSAFTKIVEAARLAETLGARGP